MLIGNPNTGKSLIFSRITGKGTIAANYVGTTMELKTGQFHYRGIDYELIDGPGIYSLEEFSKADETAVRLIDNSDAIINIVDATNLERNLYLTMQLIDKRKPMVVCLNFWDDTSHKGITINVPALEKLLDLPVVKASALCNEGISNLVASLDRARTSSLTLDSGHYWDYIGSIVGKSQKLTHRHHTLLERLGDFTIHPVGGLVSATAVLLAALGIVHFIGEWMTETILEPFYSDFYAPLILNLAKQIPYGFIKGLLIGYTADPLESFGILTSGVYIALVLVFPYFTSFYFMFGILEDFGYLPRLSVVLDNFFHRLGLHGYSAIPVMFGLGCKVPSFLATRGLSSRREKILTVSLILMSAPCLPQSAMIISLGLRYGIPTVIEIFAVLLILAFGMNILMNRHIKGDSIDFFTELPSYRIPSLSLMARKLWMRIAEYFAEVFPLIIAGTLIINIFNILKILSFTTYAIQKPVSLLLGLPSDIAPIILLGFLRKDVSIALLAPLNLSAHQFFIASIFLVLYTPCISSFFVLIKEMGVLTTFKVIGLIFISAIVSTTILHILYSIIMTEMHY